MSSRSSEAENWRKAAEASMRAAEREKVERYDGTLRDVFSELRPWEWPIGAAWIAAVRSYEVVKGLRS